MPDNKSRALSQKERKILYGFSDIYWPEPEQILPTQIEEEEEKPETPADKLLPIREKAVTLSQRITTLKDKVDKKCAHLSVSTGEPPGSNLFQAMWRLFKRETTDITYEDYKNAVILRQKLAEEDRAQKETQERQRRTRDGVRPGSVYPMGKA